MGDMEIVMAMLQGLFIFFFIAGLTVCLARDWGEEWDGAGAHVIWNPRIVW